MSSFLIENPRRKSRTRQSCRSGDLPDGLRRSTFALPRGAVWIYDLRTNLHFTLKENTLKRTDLDDFVACYFGRAGGDASAPRNRHDRKESERFRFFTYEELTKRDKVNLDIFWLKDDAPEESANLPAPEIIAADIAADLEAALEQFATIAEDLKRWVWPGGWGYSTNSSSTGDGMS